MELTTIKNLPQKARLLALAGDQTRLKIMCLLFTRRNICVSDIAGELGLSVATVSHHLQVLHANGLAKSRRAKNNICYTLADTDFIKHLKKLMCN